MYWGLTTALEGGLMTIPHALHNPKVKMSDISISEPVTRVFTHLTCQLLLTIIILSLGGFQLNQNNPITNQVLTTLCEIDSQMNTAEWPFIRGTKE